MAWGEPLATALVMASFGLMMALAALVSRYSGKLGLPVPLVFLAIGMLAGSDGLGGWAFEDYSLAFRLGTVALTLILFHGGLNTPFDSLRSSIGPAALLATVGVLGTAGLVAVAARWLGFSWPEALLFGAVVSSTDAAAVFSVLRGSGLNLRRRVGLTLELESGINDPTAVILTTSLTTLLVRPDELSLWEVALLVPLQLAVGLAAGVVIGMGAWALLRRVRLPAGGLFPVLTVAIALMAYGLPTLFYGSGFLAAYVAGLMLGRKPLPYHAGIVRVHDAIAWLAQVGMFLMLGLLVFPSGLVHVAVPGLVLGVFLALVARPLSAIPCLLPFGYAPREVLYVGWVGLRGAVPIILATYPILQGASRAHDMFDMVFFVVVVSTLLPGATVGWITRWMRMEAHEPPIPPASVEISTMQDIGGEVLSFYLRDASAVVGVRIADIPFPPQTAVLLIARGDRLFAPRGTTELQSGDHVFVFCTPEDRPLIQLLFGQLE